MFVAIALAIRVQERQVFDVYVLVVWAKTLAKDCHSQVGLAVADIPMHDQESCWVRGKLAAHLNMATYFGRLELEISKGAARKVRSDIASLKLAIQARFVDWLNPPMLEGSLSCLPLEGQRDSRFSEIFADPFWSPRAELRVDGDIRCYDPFICFSRKQFAVIVGD